MSTHREGRSVVSVDTLPSSHTLNNVVDNLDNSDRSHFPSLEMKQIFI